MGEGRVVLQEGSELGQFFLCQSVLVAYELCNAGILVVVWDEFDEFGEVIAVPLSYAHSEQVDVFVELVEEGDGLYDHVVYTVDVELQFSAGVGVAKTELGFNEVSSVEALEKLWCMEADPAKDFL